MILCPGVKKNIDKMIYLVVLRYENGLIEMTSEDLFTNWPQRFLEILEANIYWQKPAGSEATEMLVEANQRNVEIVCKCSTKKTFSSVV